MRLLDRCVRRLPGFAISVALGFVVGLVGGASLGYPSAVSSYSERAALLSALRNACLSGNGNACELYIAEIKR